MTAHITPINASVYAKSTRTSKFTADDVYQARQSLQLMPILDRLTQWQEQDNGTGGRKADLSFEALLIAMLLLRPENAPQLMTEVANVFYQRLTPEAAHLLGVAHIRPADTHIQNWRRWYNRTTRCMQRLLELVEPWPARRQVMNAAERAYETAQQDETLSLIKRARLDWLCNALLEMTFRELPADVQALWKGDIAVDQTKVPAVSKRGRAKLDRKAGQRTVKNEPDSLVMEMEADWYNHAPEFRGRDDKKARAFTWGYAANFAVMVPPDPTGIHDDALPHPLLAIGMKFSTPIKDLVAHDTIQVLQSLQDRGHPAGRITGDKEYFAQQLPENLLFPAQALGYHPVTDYRTPQLGLNGNIGGAIQVEGQCYCPMMKKGLINASVERNAGTIDAETYEARVEKQRPLYQVHRKGVPKPDGTYAIQCPAVGLSPSVTCSIRDIHPDAAKKARPHVTAPPEHLRDRICTQTSVKVFPDETTRYLQPLRYGSAEWKRVYGFDRAAIERMNSIAKDRGKENLENTALRLTRGFAAAAVFTALTLVSANRRQTAAWARKNAEREVLNLTPRKKSFTPVSLDNYRPRGPMLNPDGTITLPTDIAS